MLDLSRYLLGVAEIGVLVGATAFAASGIRSRLLPEFEGPPAHLATAVISLALLIWAAEALGTVGVFTPAAYVALVLVASVWIGSFVRRRAPRPGDRTHGQGAPILTAIAVLIAVVAAVHFAAEVRPKLTTGMTGFDSTWYHGPFAAGFFQSGDTWGLHHIAPQFLAWFYPANAEIFHSVGMLAFDRDVLSPLLNLGWFIGCLVACWCIGRPYGVAPWSLALGAVALSVPALSDQAGEARNDIVGIFFLLAAVAVALDAWAVRGKREGGLGTGTLLVVGLAAGLAGGAKLNFLLPALVLCVGLAVAAGTGLRWRAFATAGVAALAGGGYWYLRNLVHTGNPLPWFDNLGPIALPAPDQALGGREAHSVIGYLFDGAVWSDWFLPGLHDGLTVLWPLLLLVAGVGLLLCLSPRADEPLRIAGLVGFAAALAWLVAPTSASGPDGMPRGFESGLRYLAPTLVLGLTLLPTTAPLRGRLAAFLQARSLFVPHSDPNSERTAGGIGWKLALAAVVAAAAVCVGYPVQRHYLDTRYADPAFTTPGLDAAFKWARSVSGARIATTTTRQYPYFGTDLSNRVEFVGESRPHGGFIAPASCRAWRRLLDEGDYDYVIASRDRIEPAKTPYPPSARWTEGPGAEVVLRKPPTVVFKLTGPLDPSGCR